jgi:hypothetical protein
MSINFDSHAMPRFVSAGGGGGYRNIHRVHNGFRPLSGHSFIPFIVSPVFLLLLRLKPVLVLELLHQLHIFLLRLLGGLPVIDDLLPCVVLGLALLVEIRQFIP